MNLKQRVKTYSFWVSLASAIFLILRVVGEHFGFAVNENLFSEIFTALCSILVLLGIIVPPKAKTKEESTQELLQNSTINNMEENMEELENEELEIDEELIEFLEKPATNIVLHCLETIKCVIGENLNELDELDKIKELIDLEILKCKNLHDEEKTQNATVLNEKDSKISQSNEKNIFDIEETAPAATAEQGTEQIAHGAVIEVEAHAKQAAEQSTNVKTEAQTEQVIKQQIVAEVEPHAEQEFFDTDFDAAAKTDTSDAGAVSDSELKKESERAVEFDSTTPVCSEADRAVEDDLYTPACNETSKDASADTKVRPNFKRMFSERTLARLSKNNIR